MPLLAQSSYRSPFWLFNGHLQTIIPSTLRRVKGVHYQRERIDTPDGDFLDLDWSQMESRVESETKSPTEKFNRLVILSHGLEGSSDRQYIKGMVRAFNRAGWDALAWNCRGCSGEINRLARFYHHGDTEDLHTVIQHVLSKEVYSEIALVGFSMGGSMILKWLGEKGENLPVQLKKAVAFSVPCDLGSSALCLAKPSNALYRRRFLKKLERKIWQKAQALPQQIQYEFADIRVFRDFDNRYTAPLHGFADADDFYTQGSARLYLSGIRIPTLLINAANDPLLTSACYPIEEAKNHPYLYLEIPKQGGHVGFSNGSGEELWSERRAVEFVTHS